MASTEEIVQQALAALNTSLCNKIEIGGLMSRNQTAHKWKAPYRSLQLREVVFWRLQDLLNQSFLLHQQGHGLGARILLRSAFETLAMLIYGNQLMDQVLIGSLNFHEFSTKTEVLLLGSRDGITPFNSINILTVLTKCDNQYPGILAKYERLSESAHPNYEGMSDYYTDIDHEAHVIKFCNLWTARYGETHLDEVMLCIKTFQHEYDDVWPPLFEQLESWIEANDAELEATKKGAPATES